MNDATCIVERVVTDLTFYFFLKQFGENKERQRMWCDVCVWVSSRRPPVRKGGVLQYYCVAAIPMVRALRSLIMTHHI